MRAFECRDGGTAKFWNVSRDGATVTVHYGRIGTAGQTKPKEFAAEAAATAHVDKLVAEKLKKGYTEVTAAGTAPPTPAAPAPPAALPDEDTFVLPPVWRRVLLPRRGGVPGSARKTDAAAVAAADKLFETVRDDVAFLLKHRQCEPEIVAEVHAFLTHGLAGASPLGVAAAMAALHNWRTAEEYGVFADAWVAARGVVFAARVVAERSGLAAGRKRTGRPGCRCVRPDTADEVGWEVWRTWYVHAQRVRAHLATASDDDYAEACEALAEYRHGSLRQRAAMSFLLPTQTDWVDADCRELATRTHSSQLGHVLWDAASTADHLAVAGGHLNRWSLAEDLSQVVTPADGARQALVPVLVDWLDNENIEPAGRQRLFSVLAVLPGDASFQALAERLGQKYALPAVLDATKRYPKRAVRLLAAAAHGTSANARTAGDLLRAHVLGNPAAVDAVLPDLDAPARERVAAIRDEVAAVPEAPADALPAVLVKPPWTTKRTAKPVIVAGLTRPEDSAIVWLPGERDEWLAGGTMSYPYPPAAWADVARLHAANPRHGHGIRLLAEGPEELARPLLPTWKPGGYWIDDDTMRRVIARFELDALPPVLDLARAEPAAQGALLLPYAGPEVADLMADWLARLKSARTVALAWLARHPAAASQALVPAALGKPGRERHAAERALYAIVAAGHRATVSEAAESYGSEAAAAIETFLATDPLEILPPKMPTLPGWLDPALLPQVLLRDRATALPRESGRHVCTMLAMSRPGEVYAGVDVVKQVCDPASLAGFGWALFQRWQAAGAPAKEGWVLPALGWFGDDETVRRLAPVIRAWPGEGGHNRAITGLEVLTAIGTDLALMHLHGIAQKAKFNGLKERAAEKVAEVAADLGLSAAELADRLVPDLGLDASGSLTLDYGPRQFTVGFDEQLKPYVADAAGTRRSALPKPGARDDQELAPAAYQRFAALKKDVRTIAGDQIMRLERAMVYQRRWSAPDFRRLFVAHPLLWHIVRRLVWATFDADGNVRSAFRVAEDRTFADVDDDTVDLDDDAVVGVPHPVHLGAAVPAWAELLADYEILQPFPQLGRAVHTLTDAERAEPSLERFRGAKVATTKLVGLQRRGWERGDPQDAGIQGWVEKDFADGRTVVVHLDPGIPVGDIDYWPEQQLTEICIHSTRSGFRHASGSTTFGTLDPVTVSELLSDLTEVTS